MSDQEIETELFAGRVDDQSKKASDFPADGSKFVIDYVRVWKKGVEDSGCQTTVNLISNPGFENGLSGWSVTGNATLEEKLPSHAGNKHVGVASGGDGALEKL